MSQKFSCINCGKAVDELYKKYSPTVLKLSNCKFCKNVADKYVEYDTMIIIIDLILLSKEAFRHIIFNTDFKIHWKLAILLQVVETYAEWRTSSFYSKKDIIQVNGLDSNNFEFYKLFGLITLRAILFVIGVLFLTKLYNFVYGRNTNYEVSMKKIWKCLVLSSFGMFLYLPTLIWGQSSTQQYHIMFVSLYTTFCQLIAYKVILNCPKLWSILVILFSYMAKLYFWEAEQKTFSIFKNSNLSYSTIFNNSYK